MLRGKQGREAEDWASCGNNLQNTEDSITNQYFIVAENKDKQIIGFSSIRQDGYLHTMFIHKDFQRQGIASLLYKQIEKYAFKNNILSRLSDFMRSLLLGLSDVQRKIQWEKIIRYCIWD